MNIIYLVCHDLGRWLGCYGRAVESPNLDRFFRGNIQFNRAFCSSAVCSPSRGCAMTGSYAHSNGLMGLSHHGWKITTPTIVDYFNEGGYDTLHCGLSHEGYVGENRYQVDMEASWRSRNAENAFDDAIAFLRQRRGGGGRPFYLNIGTQEVHRCQWDSDDCALPSSRLNRVYGGAVPQESVCLPATAPDREIFREHFSRFQASIRYFDEQFGRLVEAIERYGHQENTLVVVTTDHGIAAARGKGTLYDLGTEIALAVQMPQSLRRSFVSEHLIPNIDFTPTLLDAAQLPLPKNIQGKSFWGLLAGENYTPHEMIFQEWNCGGGQEDYHPVRAVRTQDARYLRNYEPRGLGEPLPHKIPENYTPSQDSFIRPWPDFSEVRPSEEFYDLARDPDEMDNCAEKLSWKEKKAFASSLVDIWMKETHDPLLLGIAPKENGKKGWGIEGKN